MNEWQSDDPALNPKIESAEANLARLPLGAGPRNKGKLMYECGYAAGVASVHKLSSSRIRRWKVLCIAASMFAIGTLASQFVSSNIDSEMRSTSVSGEGQVVKQSDVATQPDHEFSWYASVESAFESSTQNSGRLPSSLGVASSVDLAESDDRRTIVVPDDRQQVLTPRDSLKVF